MIRNLYWIEIMNQYNICILDDHPVVSMGINSVIKNYEKFKIQKIFQNSNDFFLFLENNHVDVLILDIDINEENGLDILKKIKNSYPNIKTIIYSMHESEGIFREAILAGANAYVSKADDIDDVTAKRYP